MRNNNNENSVPMEDYEEIRRQRMMKNASVMASLGLIDAGRNMLERNTEKCFVGNGGYRVEAEKGHALYDTVTSLHEDRKRHSNRWRGRQAAKGRQSPQKPIRTSKRLRGLGVDVIDSEKDKISGSESDFTANIDHIVSKGKKRVLLKLDPTITYVAPFTLLSIQTTILDLGVIHRGPWAQRYWSSKGCMFHHAYPVGYRATKSVFGRVYEMRIEAGTSGPEFIVIDTCAGHVFRGNSPTKPWTEVCIAHRTGQRISGPLFFGFSDVTTQEAIAKTLYSQKELVAALKGETVEPDLISFEEIAARDFANLQGIGDNVARSLALTMSLGGYKHSGVLSLRKWIKEDQGKNVDVLRDFLLQSEEIPLSTRKWSAWKLRFVPKIIEQLLEQ